MYGGGREPGGAVQVLGPTIPKVNVLHARATAICAVRAHYRAVVAQDRWNGRSFGEVAGFALYFLRPQLMLPGLPDLVSWGNESPAGCWSRVCSSQS